MSVEQHPQIDADEESALSTGSDPPSPNERRKTDTTYIALDGVSEGDIRGDGAEQFLIKITNLVLGTFGWSVENVRLVPEDAGVVELYEQDSP